MWQHEHFCSFIWLSGWLHLTTSNKQKCYVMLNSVHSPLVNMLLHHSPTNSCKHFFMCFWFKWLLFIVSDLLCLCLMVEGLPSFTVLNMFKLVTDSERTKSKMLIFCIVLILPHHYVMLNSVHLAAGYASQHIWCLSQARINREGCVRNGHPT